MTKIKSEVLRNIFKDVIKEEYDNLLVEADIVTLFISYLKKYCRKDDIKLNFKREYPYGTGQRGDLHISTTENNITDNHFIEFKYYWDGGANNFSEQVQCDKDKLVTLRGKGKLYVFCFYRKKFKETAEELYTQLTDSKIIPEFISSY